MNSGLGEILGGNAGLEEGQGGCGSSPGAVPCAQQALSLRTEALVHPKKSVQGKLLAGDGPHRPQKAAPRGSPPQRHHRRSQIFTNKCLKPGCKQKEMMKVICEQCHKNYCLKHRHPLDHDCSGAGHSLSKAG